MGQFAIDRPKRQNITNFINHSTLPKYINIHFFQHHQVIVTKKKIQSWPRVLGHYTNARENNASLSRHFPPLLPPDNIDFILFDC